MGGAHTLCPSCHQGMTRHRFAGRLHGEVELDLCFPCQAIWFDDFESSQLTPGGVIELFRLIHQHRDDQRLPLAERLPCPRCSEALRHAFDRVRSGVFNYHRCLQRHGRLTTFAQFMTEKGFVRQLSGAELARLRASIGVVRCNSCGAPVDIRHDAACGHCRSPLVVLDPAAVEAALAGYQRAEVARTTVDPAALADALIAKERARKADQAGEWGSAAPGVDVVDLLVAGAGLVWSLIRR